MDFDFSVLKGILKDENRIITENIEDKYQSDTLGRLKGTASAVLFPISANEVSAILKFSFENEIPVTPRGAGTNLVGSTVPVSGGIILDLSKMNRILELDKETLTATVEAGVVLDDFQKFIESEGLFYPPDPGEKSATIGGNVSTNAGGMRAVKYGVTRDYVLGLEVVLANGDILKVGSKNIKDSSGLSLKNLIIGSEGTLAIITKCILKVIPKPELTVSILVPYSSLQIGIESVFQIIRENANPTAIEFVEKTVVRLGEKFLNLEFPFPEAVAYILLTFDGSKEEVEANIKKVKKVTTEYGALDFLQLEDHVATNVWNIRGALVKAVEAVSEQEPIDIVIPINKTVEFISFIHELEEKTGIQMVSFGHAGDGNIHLCIVRGSCHKKEWKNQLKNIMLSIYTYAYKLGGLTSGEHGIGISKRDYFLKHTDTSNIVIMNKIKDALDKKHILNNHKVYMD